MATVHDLLADLKARYLLLEGDRNSYFASSQRAIKDGRAEINTYTQENEALKRRLAELRAAAEHQAGSIGARGIISVDAPIGRVPFETYKRLLEAVHSQKRALDSLREIRAARGQEVESLDYETVFTEKLGQGARDEASNQRRTRELENRLEKAMIKYNEARSVCKTYEVIVARLKSDKVSHGLMLEEMEAELGRRDAEIAELKLLANDARHVRDTANEELATTKRDTEAVHAQRVQEIIELKAQVQASAIESRKATEAAEAEAAARAAAAAPRKEDRGEAGDAALDQTTSKVNSYETALRRLQDATGLKAVDDVIRKFLTQGDTNTNLTQMAREAEKKIASLTAERAEAKKALDELRYTSAGQLGSRRVIDEFDSQLTEGRHRLETAQAKHERAQWLYVTASAGVNHLSDKLSKVKLDKPVATSKNDDPCVEQLALCEHKLVALLEDIEDVQGHPMEPQRLTSATAGAKHKPGEIAPPPALSNNTRIELATDAINSGSDKEDDGEEDDPLGRSAVKRRSNMIMQSHTEGKKGKSNKKTAPTMPRKVKPASLSAENQGSQVMQPKPPSANGHHD